MKRFCNSIEAAHRSSGKLDKAMAALAATIVKKEASA